MNVYWVTWGRFANRPYDSLEEKRHVLMAHTWAIVTLTLDSTCCQTTHDLVLE
jgi:hypothetical protein